MDVAGAAIATVFAQFVSVVCSVVVLRKQDMPIEFSREQCRIYKEELGKILNVGVPIALQETTVQISFLVVNSVINQMGLMPSAGYGIAQKIVSFIMLVPSSIMQSVSAFVAQNIGAGKKSRAWKGFYTAIITGCSVGIIIFMVGFFGGGVLSSFFTNDSEVIAQSAAYLKGFSADCILTCVLFSSIGYFNGCGKSIPVMIQGITSAFCIRIPVSIIMSRLPETSLTYVGMATPITTVYGKKYMDLFDYMKETTMEKESPLASRMRPTTLDEVVGQEHIIGPGKLLYRAIKADKLGSVIFYGPPGTGKTTLARVIANTTSAEFTQLNATTAGKKDMEEVVKEAQQRIGMYGKKTILFVDEIHRFNKGQQDYLLPFVEDGTLVLIGATTENPYFEVNGALISRSIIFELKPLEKEDIEKLLERAVTDPVKGLGTYNVVLDADAKEFLADIAGGDARAALNAIELGVLSTERQADGKIHIDLETASECIQKRVVRYDKTGDQHYDTISAFIKSMRGSDPDAAVFYLAKMLYAGEDIKFIARRIMICAAEDVGLADPNALNVAVSASLAVERVGMPEAQIILAEAATYVACAPKSNSSCEAVFAAMKTVGSVRTSVPPHLQDAHYKGSVKLGHGEGYQYAHDYPNHYVEQQYLPDEILGSRFLHLGTNGYEQKIRENFKKIGKDIE